MTLMMMMTRIDDNDGNDDDDLCDKEIVGTLVAPHWEELLLRELLKLGVQLSQAVDRNASKDLFFSANFCFFLPQRLLWPAAELNVEVNHNQFFNPTQLKVVKGSNVEKVPVIPGKIMKL